MGGGDRAVARANININSIKPWFDPTFSGCFFFPPRRVAEPPFVVPPVASMTMRHFFLRDEPEAGIT